MQTDRRSSGQPDFRPILEYCGVPAQPIACGLYTIRISNYGLADAGPHHLLAKYWPEYRHQYARAGGRMEAHHIVGGEHLDLFRTGYTYDTGPCVLVASDYHSKVFSRDIADSLRPLGGRAFLNYGRKYEDRLSVPRFFNPPLTRKSLLSVYADAYRDHPELYAIARHILTERA